MFATYALIAENNVQKSANALSWHSNQEKPMYKRKCCWIVPPDANGAPSSHIESAFWDGNRFHFRKSSLHLHQIFAWSFIDPSRIRFPTKLITREYPDFAYMF